MNLNRASTVVRSLVCEQTNTIVQMTKNALFTYVCNSDCLAADNIMRTTWRSRLVVPITDDFLPILLFGAPSSHHRRKYKIESRSGLVDSWTRSGDSF